VGDLHIDVGARRVLRHEVDLDVSGLTFDLLLALVQASPALATFDELMERVWAGVIVSPETLTQRVKLLRQALGDSADQPRYIAAVRGHGYRLIPAATNGDQELIRKTPYPKRRQLAVAAVAGLVVIGVAALAAAWWGLRDGGGQRAPSASLQAEAEQFIRQAQGITSGSPASFLAAMSLYDEALSRDPDSVSALAGRAMNRAALVWTGSPLGRGLDLAQRDAERALTLAPSNLEATAALASINAMRGNWREADAQFRAAITAHPRDPGIRARYAVSLLLPTGQLRRAVEEATQAQALSADREGFTAAMLALARSAQGSDAEAVRYADLMLVRGGDPRQVAQVYISAASRSGHYQEAAERAISVMTVELHDAGADAAIRQGFAALASPAQRDAALSALRKLTNDPAWENADTWTHWPVLHLLSGLGAMDDLHAEMARLLPKGGDTFPQIIAVGALWSPEMRPFRQDRRFGALVERLRLTDFWRNVAAPDGCKLVDGELDCSAP